jgi:hypothetical protein
MRFILFFLAECQYAAPDMGFSKKKKTTTTTIQEDKSEEYSSFVQKIRNITTKTKNDRKKK